MSLKSRDCIDSEALVLVRHRDGDPHCCGGGGGEGGRLLEDGALQDKARVRTLDRTLPLTHADQAPVLPSQGWGQFHLEKDQFLKLLHYYRNPLDLVKSSEL